MTEENQRIQQDGAFNPDDLKQSRDLLIAGKYQASMYYHQPYKLVLQMFGVEDAVIKLMLGDNRSRFSAGPSIMSNINLSGISAMYAAHSITLVIKLDPPAALAANCKDRKCCDEYNGFWGEWGSEGDMWEYCLPKGWGVSRNNHEHIMCSPEQGKPYCPPEEGKCYCIPLGGSHVPGRIVCTPEQGTAKCSQNGECVCVPPGTSGVCGRDSCFICSSKQGTALCPSYGSCICVPEGSDSSCSDTECISCTAEKGKALCPSRGTCTCVPDDAEGKCYGRKCFAIQRKPVANCWPKNSRAVCDPEFETNYKKDIHNTLDVYFSSVILNEDETILVTVESGLWYDEVELNSGSRVVLHKGDSISTRPEYVGTSITYKKIQGNKLLFEVHHWTDILEYNRKQEVLIYPYIKE